MCGGLSVGSSEAVEHFAVLGGGLSPKPTLKQDVCFHAGKGVSVGDKLLLEEKQ